MWYLISYDIRNPRRLQRVHRVLKPRSYALLESLFLFNGSAAELEALRNALWKEIKPGTDDLLIYRLRTDQPIRRWGTGCLPAGLYNFSLPPIIEHRDSRAWLP